MLSSSSRLFFFVYLNLIGLVGGYAANELYIIHNIILSTIPHSRGQERSN